MFVFSAHIHASDPDSRRVQADIQSLYDRLPSDRRLRVSIRGSNHFTFSDDGALLKSRLVRIVLRMFGQLKIDGSRQLAVTAYCVRSFLTRMSRAQTHRRFRLPLRSTPRSKCSSDGSDIVAEACAVVPRACEADCRRSQKRRIARRFRPEGLMLCGCVVFTDGRIFRRPLHRDQVRRPRPLGGRCDLGWHGRLAATGKRFLREPRERPCRPKAPPR
jgi:hypothetical protein